MADGCEHCNEISVSTREENLLYSEKAVMSLITGAYS